MSPSAFLLVSVLIFVSSHVECKTNFANDLGNFAEAIGNIFSSIDDCKYTCPSGVQPVVNPLHKMSANGCGSYGVQFKVGAVPGSTECCNKHDYCYDTCNSDKSVCDRKLNHCLQHICYEMDDTNRPKKSVQECRTVVQYIFGGVSAVGCDAYMNAQQAACTCHSDRQTSKKSKYQYT